MDGTKTNPNMLRLDFSIAGAVTYGSGQLSSGAALGAVDERISDFEDHIEDGACGTP